MDDKNKNTAQIVRLQKNLSSIRKIAGWTAEQLGEKIGVTKQTISNLENEKTPMTLTQYIAIRAIIDYEIQANKENVVLPKVVEILLDKEEEYSEEEHDRISKNVSTIASTAAGGASGAPLLEVAKLLLGVFFINFDGVVKTSVWLSKIMKGSKKKK